MNFDVATGTEVIAVFNDWVNLFIRLSDFNADLINLKGFHRLVQVRQWIEVIAPLVEIMSYLSELLGLDYLFLLELKHLLAK